MSQSDTGELQPLLYAQHKNNVVPPGKGHARHYTDGSLASGKTPSDRTPKSRLSNGGADKDENDWGALAPNRLSTASTTRTANKHKISSLDFERVINEYSIQATRERYQLGPIPDESKDGNLLEENNDGLRQRTSDKQHVKRISSLSYGGADSPQITREIGKYGTHGSPQIKVKNSTGRTATRWAISTIIGLFTGLVAILIVQTTGAIVEWRTRTLDQMAQSDRLPNGIVFLGFTCINLILAISASLLCIYVAPEGTGSGIPEVQAYLNGVRVKKFTSWRLLAVKIVGTVLSVSSSLAVGMEGPLVHIGAIIGASFTKLAGMLTHALTTIQLSKLSPVAQEVLTPLKQSLLKFTTMNLSHFSIDAERRDFVSIGASVGFAASFGAPIGGLLFVLYDISSYFSKNMFLRTLVANAVGTFCLALQSGNLSNYSIINLGSFQRTDDYNDIFVERFEIVPLYVLVGIAGGVLGGVFCKTFEFIKTHVSSKLITNRAKLIEVALLSVVTSSLTFGLPIVGWACKPAPDDAIGGRQFFCGSGEVNEMATIMFGSRDEGIKRILSDPSQFQQRTLWTVGVLFYGLMTITYGSVIPSGIFTPTVLIGASLGGALGLALEDWLGSAIIPSTFALLGVAAMLAGVQRSTLSICVILVEGTGQIKVLLPTIIVVLVARSVAELFHSLGLFETSMALKKYPYLYHEERRRYDIFEIGEIMTRPVHVVDPFVKASTIVRLLESSPHNGYPVVDPSTKKFLGLVRRDQMVALLECGVFEDCDPSVIEAAKGSIAGSDTSLSSSLKPGASKSPLMHWAYHIKDDRYDYVTSNETVAFSENSDEFDSHEWLRNVRKSIRRLPSNVIENTVVTGDDSMPPMQLIRDSSAIEGAKTSTSGASFLAGNHSKEDELGFAKVGINEIGNLYISWMNPDFCDRYVSLAAVMNQGTFCVPVHLPVSKARFLFTQLGLRHVVVLGGRSGGEVVGIFTRANLMPGYIAEKTGVTFQ